MTKNKIFHEIKTAMKAGQFENLTLREKKIYKNAFKNGYKLSKLHTKENKIYVKRNSYKPLKIVGHSFSKPNKNIIDSIINKVCVRYEVSKKLLFTKIRTTDIVRSRNIIHNILSEKYKMSLTEIGKIFGQDHTTVLNSIQMKQQKRRFWSQEQTLWQEFDELIKS
jgi:chromosomal replication initiation ATPase DnaA|tara:strand:+ start:112 stop:609 length:498 start_codon:yes stop_codon:yes gene_type:complete